LTSDLALADACAVQLPLGVKAGQHWWYCAGLAHAQEAVSQLPIQLLAPRPGERVLDLCAAPGGKTAQIAFALGNRGTLVANDFAVERIAALQGNLDRLGVVNVSTTRCDGGNFPAAAGGFDCVLVDAPCSSEGTLRRHPRLAAFNGPLRSQPRKAASIPSRAQSAPQTTAPADKPSGSRVGLEAEASSELPSQAPAESGPETRLIAGTAADPLTTERVGSGRGEGRFAKIGLERSQRMAGRQRTLLRKAVQLCRPGGRILYSTCTFAPEENELVVAEILDQFGGDLSLRPVRVPGLASGAGITEWQGRRLDPQLAGCLRIWPHLSDTGGFFIALIEKHRDARGPEPAASAAAQADAEDSAWLSGLQAHYGLPSAVLEQYRAQRQTRRGLHLMVADHQPPVAPGPQGSGLFTYRTNLRPPKLSTAGALLLGSAATRNRLELTAAQRDRYLRREPLRPSPAQTADCQLGQVLVFYAGFPLGVAVLHRSGDLESLFPRRWSGCTSASTTG
jgi:16S rRNA C967 or C1407 C5-methylase (RsmB/RsmF family)